MDRSRKKESIVRIKVEKDYSFRDGVFSIVDTCCEGGMVPNCSLPESVTRPPRESKGKVIPDTFSHSWILFSIAIDTIY